MINIQVRTIGSIRRILGAAELDITLEEGATIETLFRCLIRQYGDAFAYLVTDSEGRIATPHTRVLINGRDLFLLNNMDTVLSEGDIVSLISVIAGGL